MKIDLVRIKKYLIEIKRYSMELRQLIEKNELTPGSIPLNAAKYILIELAEAMSNTIQHILAKDKGVPVSGYIDAILKAHENGIIEEDLFQRLKPFFDFRNSLIHRYWTVNDLRLIENIKNGLDDFDTFTDSIETYIRKRADIPH